MDNDLISRSELKEHFSNYDLTRGIINIQEVMYYIDNAPTVEQPQGEWIYHKGLSESRECSNCGVWLDWDLVRNSYCPNCGAKMKQG